MDALVLQKSFKKGAKQEITLIMGRFRYEIHSIFLVLADHDISGYLFKPPLDT